MALKSVHHSVYVVGANIQVYDLFDMAQPKEMWEGQVVNVTKKFVTLQHPLGGHPSRFHRVTGYQVGFHWPNSALAVRPQTS